MHSPKICRIKRSLFTSIICKVVSYKRSKSSGSPYHEILKAFPTVRSNTIHDPFVRKSFWTDVELFLLESLVAKVLTNAEAERIRDAFEAVIPKPAKPIVPPIAKPIARTPKADLLARFPILASGK